MKYGRMIYLHPVWMDTILSLEKNLPGSDLQLCGGSGSLRLSTAFSASAGCLRIMFQECQNMADCGGSLLEQFSLMLSINMFHKPIVYRYWNSDSLVWSKQIGNQTGGPNSKQIWYSQSAQKFWLELFPQKNPFAASLSPWQPNWASMMWMSVASASSWGWTSMCHRIRLILPRVLVSRILLSVFLVSCFWSQSRVFVYVF